ncbi:hypothetical protein [Paenibacillus cremeus]|uniref:Uncharacterized protein n=1 Tax=Paenibacillus cremeus TaxID=2163881 RepID=A0A559K3M7_9BACL|nr:hypothetical protein [Paenibacillus cremeus]TVY06716.1 hypothetical protein FPZ49_27540 [Paenibacillus cremeus]
MPFVTHVNHVTKYGSIYCCLRNKVVPLNDYQISHYCSGCKMNQGVEQGDKVQCYWNDVRNISNPHIVYDPQTEFKRMQAR